MPTIEELLPSNDELGPQNPRYLARVGLLLPHFPPAALGSWFSEHPLALETYHPLGLENLRFRLERWTAEAIGGAEILRTGTSLAKLQQDLEVSNRWVRDGMMKNGTWNSPPIVLDVERSIIPVSFTHPLRDKKHLLEGHHRFAMAMLLAENGDPIEHDFWIVTVEAPASDGAINSQASPLHQPQ